MEADTNEIREVRLRKLRTLEDSRVNPFPSIAKKTISNSQAVVNFDVWSQSNKTISLSGRLMSKREHGGLIFGDLKDFSGSMQILFKKDAISNKDWQKLIELIDIGDFLSVKGTLFMTQKNEKTLLVSKYDLWAKSLRPLPEKWHGLVDIETRYRQRYLDLLMNQDVKDRFIVRHKLIQELRNFLIKQNFIEVDTPALQPLPGGALATPFKTHYDAIDADVYLRIAPELYLKRLIVGGFEKVFEFARVFRNEGVSSQHLQDFTMLEFYQAYSNYKDLMKLTEKMLSTVIKKVLATDTIQFGDQTIDLRAPWPQKTLRVAILEKTNIDIDQCPDIASLQLAIQSQNINMTYTGKTSRGKLIDELYKETVRPTLINPIFITDHPVDLSPLAKKQVKDPDKVERFQLVIAGIEIVNAFSELNDPIDQQARFNQQSQNKAAGDEEAHLMDKDFVKALEYGMPPTAGFGMGVDRLVMLLTNADSIREAVLFPFVKPR